MPFSVELSEGKTTAVAAESLYLVNLLLAPGLGFIALLILWWRAHADAPPLAAAHLTQTVTASLWAGLLLIIANAIIVTVGGYHGPYTWVVAITYFTICHATLVMFGAFGLSKAIAGQCWRFPLVGRPLPTGCGR